MRNMKRVLSLMLAVLMLATVLTAIPVTAAATDISTAEGFASIANGGTYRLTADITITSQLPERSNITLDGQGHTITLKSTMKAGAFAKLTSSTVKNLTVKGENDSIMVFNPAKGGGVSGVVANLTGSNFENVTNEVNILINSYSDSNLKKGGSWVGGVVGNIYTSTLKNCVNKGNITVNHGEYVGGIAGVNYDESYYIGCKNYGNIKGKQGTDRNGVSAMIGYVFSQNSAVHMTDCANFGKITAESNPSTSWENGPEAVAGAFGGICEKQFVEFKNCINFSDVADFGVNATAASAAPADRTITSASQLSSLTAGNIYTIANNLECAGGYTLPDGVIINGNGCTITLKNATGGLFKASTNGAIANLNIAGSINATSGSGAIGAFIDSASGSLFIKDCNNNASINVSGTGYTAVGGFVGTSSASGASITVCNNYGAITAKNAVGGIVGSTANTMEISSCSNHGALSGAATGGIIGKVESSAKSVELNASNNYGSCVSTTTPAVLGICGANAIGSSFKTTNCTDYTNDASIQAVSLKLKDDIALRFYISDAMLTGADKVVVKTDCNAPISLGDDKTFINGMQCIAYNVSISPTQLAKSVKFSVTIVKNGKTYNESKTYSVKDYCLDTIKNADADAALKQLCADLLNYGAEAQKKAGDTGTLANAGLSEAQKGHATINAPTVTSTNTYSGSANASVATWEGAEISFENGIAPVFKFKATNGVSGMVAKVTYGDGQTISISKFEELGNNLYSFKLEELSAAEFYKTITVKLEKGSASSQQLNFNIDACAAEMISGGNSAALATSALKYVASIECYIVDVGGYDIEKYAAPVWQGNIVYGESAFVRENSKNDSSVAPITLLYPIDEIVAVRSSDMKTLYKEGRDYRVEDGKLVVIPGGNIKVLPYYSSDVNQEAYTYSAVGKYTRDYMKKGDVYYYYLDAAYTHDTEGGFVKWNISVTYKHGGTSVITTPTDQSSKFEGLMDKLTSGNDIKVVSLGDSITWGASASANHAAFGGIGGTGWGPKAPAYNVMFCDYLEAAYGVNVTHKNYAIGGTTASQALNNEGSYANNAPIPKVIADDPDIFILAYGMNDGGVAPATEAQTIANIIAEVRKQCPDVYVIVVSTCLLGQTYNTSNSTRLDFGNAFEAKFASDPKVVVANVTKADIQMQGYDVEYETNHTGPKCYQDLTGSNSNHPNDFVHRIYLQVMIQSAFGENKFAQ